MAVTLQEVELFKANKLDAVGEIENITMGASATAVSTLLNAKVWITTPQVDVCKGSEIVFPELEPAIHVRIEYVEGINGFSLLVLKQNDVQLILNQLMGLPLVVTDDFEFDEINISAVSEVMNQMMGASATALSEILGMRIDISTPQATVSNGDTDIIQEQKIDPDDYICTVTFSLTIDGVINSKFVTLLDLGLASKMADMMMNQYSQHLDDFVPEPTHTEPPPPPPPAAETPAPAPPAPSPAPIPTTIPVPPPPPPPPPATAPTPVTAPPAIPEFTPPPPPTYVPPPPPQPTPSPVPSPFNAPPEYSPAQGYAPPPQYMPPPQQYLPPPPQYYYPPQPSHLMQAANPLASIDTSKFTKEQIRNLQLLMNVPMDVSIEIGSTTKRVDEILDFSQGTVFELDRAASAPVDIVVNGNLIAKGEVVVLDDNFAVKIIEINQANMTDMLSEKVS